MIRNKIHLNWTEPFNLHEKRFNLSDYYQYGIYAIWTISNNKPFPIYVGIGQIVCRLLAHRKRYGVTKHGKVIIASWADASKLNDDIVSGIEKWLIETLDPSLNINSRKSNSIETNLPFCLALYQLIR